MSTSSVSPVIQVRNLNVSFGEKQILNDVSFHINPGETLAVVGESGSGKSITSMAIMGLLPKGLARIQGSIVLEGTEIIGAEERVMRDIRGRVASMIFQEPMMSLNPVLSVGFQIKEMLRRHKRMSNAQATQEGIRLFERVRIPDAKRRFDNYPHMFSGGMRQRIMIAIALACSPKLLIADEPTTALDVTIQAQILDLLNELQTETGAAILFVTHDMGVVANMADRVMVMRQGQTIETGPLREIFERPQQPYSKMLIEAVPRLGQMKSTLPDPAYDEAEPPVLSVSNLVTRFPVHGGSFHRLQGRVHAVEGISFDIAAGETLSFVGESGCGKSTTGRSILHLNTPEQGDIRFNGSPVRPGNKNEIATLRRNVQIIFQDPFSSLDPRQTIGEILAEPMLCQRLGTRAEARERALYLLDRVGLDASMITRLPHEFSGGQRQRICIARALMLNPKLVIADEAVSALDVSVKAQVVDLMIGLQQEFGLSYLFISHDMAVVERISHRVAVMYLGEIVEIGPRKAVIDNPMHPYTQSLLKAVPSPMAGHDRHQRIALPAKDLPSPIRGLDYLPPKRTYRDCGGGHWVMSTQ